MLSTMQIKSDLVKPGPVVHQHAALSKPEHGLLASRFHDDLVTTFQPPRAAFRDMEAGAPGASREL